MRFLILGEGPETESWAETIRSSAEHTITAAWPSIPGVEIAPADLDAALAVQDIDAVIVGGPIPLRDEALRRVAAAGLHAVALHPPGPNADAYYQVALSRAETGSAVIPDLPLRFLPEIVELIPIAREGKSGSGPAELNLDVNVEAGEDDLVIPVISRWADLVRVLLGEVATVSAFGEPAGPSPNRRVTAQFRTADGGRAEVRVGRRGGPASARLELIRDGELRTLDLSDPRREDSVRHVLLDQLAAAAAGKPHAPTLIDGTRAVELAEGVAKSLKRGRVVDLHYEQVSEENNFKSVMTSLGCMILLGILVALPLSLAGPALGIGWLIYISYAIPPILVGFGLIQLLKYGIQRPEPIEGPKTG